MELFKLNFTNLYQVLLDFILGVLETLLRYTYTLIVNQSQAVHDPLKSIQDNKLN